MIFGRGESKKKESDGADATEPVVKRPPGPLRQLLVPSSILELSLKGLRGYVPREGLCYWFGRELEPQVGIVMVVAFPRIYSSEYSFELAPGQMSELTTWAQRESLWILAQVHTHPTDEPHSDADEEFSPTRRPGFLSVVIPFGAQFSNLRRPQWRTFECDEAGEWIDADNEKLRILDDLWLPEG
jgi:hypothetical protein